LYTWSFFYFSGSEIVVGSAVNGASKKGGKGKGASATSATRCNYDYNMEYAKSGRSECYACEVKIPNKEIRISKLDYNSETVLALGRGPVVSCN
jgi:hypothetical protein